MLSIPALIVGILVISFSYGVGIITWCVLDSLGVFICVLLMSISMLFYIVAGQYIFAKVFKWVPISGYVHGISALKFVILPVLAV